MSSRYDVLVVDLDGTLLNSRGEISRANREAIADAQAAGIEVIIATGRAWRECLPFLKAIDHRGVVVTAGGSMLNDSRTGCTLRRNTLDAQVAEHACQSLLMDGHKVLVLKDAHATGYDYLLLGEAALDTASEWWFKTLNVRTRHGATLADDEHPADSVRIGAVAAGERLCTVANALREHLADRAIIQHWSAVTASCAIGASTHLLEVFHPAVSKWTMIQSCCRERGIEVQRVAAIGDELNDIELICNAGLGIAMGNAIATIKSRAHRITAGHDDDGLAAAVGNILCGAW